MISLKSLKQKAEAANFCEGHLGIIEIWNKVDNVTSLHFDEPTSEFVAAANPTTILTLIAALEKAKGALERIDSESGEPLRAVALQRLAEKALKELSEAIGE